MNFLILTLALATIAGSQSFVLQDAPAQVSLTAALNKELNDWVDGIEKAIEKKWEIFEQSKSAKAISHFIDDDEEEEEKKEEESSSNGQKKESEPESVTEQVVDIISDSIDIGEKLFNALSELENATEPFLKELDLALEAALAPYLDPILAKLKPTIQPLAEKLVTRVKELDHKLEERLKEYVEILDSKFPVEIQKLQDKLESQKKAAK